jgi:hypothetical protein
MSNTSNNPIRIYHPMTAELSATIEITTDGWEQYCEIHTDYPYFSSEANSYEEAYKEAHRMLEEIYSGRYYESMDADEQYSRQERFACTGE